MAVINSIEKARLSADSYSYSGTGVAWKARLVLFLGFALMAGGLAGSVVRFMKSCGVRHVLTGVIGCHGAQIYCPGHTVSCIVFWNSECGCKWARYAEVSGSQELGQLVWVQLTLCIVL